MKTCAKCGASGTALMRTRLANYEDAVLGYDVILVNAVDHFKCSVCDHEVKVVANQEGLIAAVALARLQMNYKLSAQEIKRVRMALNLKGVEFARKLSVSAETVSRWENAERMSDEKERTLRIVAAVILAERAPLVDIDLAAIASMKLIPMRPVEFDPLCFEMIRTKVDKKKDDQWDSVDEAA